jgi:periplasmic protein TonB
MSIIRGLRYPTALAFGLLLTASIFWSLWSFTNVTFELAAIKTTKVDFSRTLVDRPPERKFQEEEVKLPPNIDTIDIGVIGGERVIVPPVTIDMPVERGDIGGQTFTVGPDRDAMPIVRVNPTYPPRAAQQGIEGWVQVQFTITGTGAVKDVIVVDSSPSNIFDKASVEAVSRWRYNPKVEGAVAVDRVGVQTLLRFDLEEE